MNRSRLLPVFFVVAAMTACNENREVEPGAPVGPVVSASAQAPGGPAPEAQAPAGPASEAQAPGAPTMQAPASGAPTMQAPASGAPTATAPGASTATAPGAPTGQATASSATAPGAASSAAVGPAAGLVSQTDPAGLKADLDAGKVALLIDVRTPGEYEGGHVPQAVNMPVDGLEARLQELASHKGEPVYVICQSGGRSARASAMLAEKGFKAVNVQGGTAGWKAAGYPTK